MSLFFSEKRSLGSQINPNNPIISGIPNAGWYGNNKQVSPVEAQRISQVIGVFDGLADAIASTSQKTYEEGSNGVRKYIRPFLVEPNPEQTWFEFLLEACLCLFYYGNSYTQMIRADNGDVLELWNVHPDRVYKIYRNNNVGPKLYQILGDTEPFRTNYNICHVKWYSEGEFLYGYSPIQRARMQVDKAFASQLYQLNQFHNQLNLQYVVTAGGDVTFESAQKAAASFEANHNRKDGKPVGVLPAGMGISTISISPADAEFVASQQWDAQMWATLLNVPLFMLNGSNVSWAGRGLDIMNMVYESRTLGPIKRRFEQSFSKFVLPENSKLELDLSEVLKISQTERAEIDNKNILNGSATRNEIRIGRGQEPIEGLDEPLQPSYILDANAMLEQQRLNNAKASAEIDNLGSAGGE